jgi:hypothetical protein
MRKRDFMQRWCEARKGERGLATISVARASVDGRGFARFSGQKGLEFQGQPKAQSTYSQGDCGKRFMLPLLGARWLGFPPIASGE